MFRVYVRDFAITLCFITACIGVLSFMFALTATAIYWVTKYLDFLELSP